MFDRSLGMREVRPSQTKSDEAVGIFPGSPGAPTAVVVTAQVSQRANPSSDGTTQGQYLHSLDSLIVIDCH